MTTAATVIVRGQTYTRDQAIERASWLRSGMAGAERIAEGDDFARALGWGSR